tara:strand:- start:260 stop:820 length:561 start_codon:yes stop_codon:yes gene_type:complete
MHKINKIYYFIDEFNRKEIHNLNKNISIIYRNYKNNHNYKLIEEIRNFCRNQKRKFYISNNLKMALKLGLDGIYIPSFNRLCNFKNLLIKKNFEILGSAHNVIELKIKENQGCKIVFLSPIFKINKSKFFLDTIKFNLISNLTKKKIVALGGINYLNFSKLNLTKAKGFASISWIKKNGPRLIGPF